MKLTAFFILAACLHVNATGYGQKITLSEREVHIEKIFTEIKKQTGYSFLYTSNVLVGTKRVSVNVTNASVTEVLDAVLAGQGLEYRVKSEDRLIIVKSAPPVKVVADAGVNTGGPIDVSGRVTDAEGRGLPGANVKVRGSSVGVTTDKDGRFSLKDVPENSVLEISYVGHEMKTFTVRGSGLVNISLDQKLSMLDETVVIAYGTTTRRFATGNVATVKAADIERQPVNNPLLALQGRVPGVEITQANGVPGGGITIRIQGRNNLNQDLVGSDPFIVIDGIPYSSQNLTTFSGGSMANPILGRSGDVRAGSFGNPLAFINPNDIESIDVLKDADATAIYGSRAANGAILITTKKGKAGPVKTDITLQQGWGQVGNKMNLLNSEQYMEMRREAKLNDNAAILNTDYDLRGLWDTTRYTDWQKELIGSTANYTRLTAGVSGGTANVQYLVNATYGRETSVFPGDFANVFGSLHFNIAVSSPNQRFKMQLGGSYMANKNELPAEDFTNAALNMPPVAPSLYNDDGTINWASDPLANGNASWFNPLARQFNLFDTKTYNLVSNGSLSYRFLKGLEFRSTFGYTSTTSDQFVGALNQSVKPEERPGRVRSAVFSFNNNRSWIIEPQLDFQQRLGSGKLGILVGSTFQNQFSEGRAFTVSGQPSDQLLRNMDAAGTFRPAGLDFALYRYSALFTRLNYQLKERYLVNLTGRRDGSSRFGANNQLNNFGAIGLGWIISEEHFFKKFRSVISFAKLRGSYGTTGNDQIGNYRFMNLFQSVNRSVPYQGQVGLSPAGLSNPNLEWEETRKLQAGIDVGYWNDRFLLTVNYICNRSSNNLTQINLPILAGYNSFIGNLPALIQNTSFEFSLNTININKTTLRWSSNLNLTIPKNKLLAFPDLENSSLGYLLVVGQPLDVRKLNAFYGIDPLTGTFLVTDQHGNPTTNPGSDDVNRLIQTGTRWYGGVQNSIHYKGFQFDIFIQFTKQYGAHVLELTNAVGRFNANASTVSGNQPVEVMNRWQKPGDFSLYQRFTTLTALSGLNQGDRRYADASFARLKNLSLSYSFSSSVLKKIAIRQMRAFMNAQNVLTLTKYRGLDPETQSVSSLPPLRMVTLGIQVGF